MELLEDCDFFNGRVNKQVSGVVSSLASDMSAKVPGDGSESIMDGVVWSSIISIYN